MRAEELTPLSLRQRLANYLVILAAFAAVAYGFIYRNSIISATFPFINREAGITARYPARWLLDESDSRFVLRAQDPDTLPFKTAIRLQLIPIGQDARPADILDLLDIDRAARLPAYRSLSRTPTVLPGGQRGQQMIYAYAYIDPNPFLQAEPITVRALDLVVLRTGQAVVITYEAKADVFEKHKHYFESFLRSLTF
ncbi:MAG: hypothetical protein CUN49_04910 [Candidatus Thermofonsia Clade 1 bacterium]|jgi:hypothetical protein|uniref:PsbP C-terminal domain-containing protein n=1 Tax=Candidatus Thermofonsia Clade 1 bacterium TaxID=2364210 RepID=A0A2M8PG69_9CHLR|nr:MAG: hypothetical protein CUN49_04910 [Candidatus Thermofonsia Clade 1 bacterium]RMF51052.1 MAG: hypothetical protein D6749_08940 [Chloroflexota bacterium]